MTTYEPGTVAVATVRGEPGVRVMRTDDNGTPFVWCAATPCDDAVWASESEVTDVRPLVVLTLPKGALAGWPVLIGALRTAAARTGFHMTFGDLIEQIEAQAGRARPDEPTGLGATVKDSDGETWVRNQSGEWINLHSRFGIDPALSWADLCDKYGPIEVTS